MPYKIQVYICGCWNDYIRHTKTKIHIQMEGTEIKKTKIFKALTAAQALVLELTKSSINCKILIVEPPIKEPPIKYVLITENDMYFAGFKKGIVLVHNDVSKAKKFKSRAEALLKANTAHYWLPVNCSDIHFTPKQI